jgi:mutator protein MutT
MTEMKKQLRILVVAAVIEKHGKVLIAQRRKDGRLGGKWEFPGGKVELDETPEQALKRELREELGIEAEIGDFFCSSCHDYPHLPVELHAYRIKAFSGEIVPHVHDLVLWVLPQDLCRYDFPEANREIMSRLADPA